MKYELKRAQIFAVNLTTGLHAEFGFFNCLAALLISISKLKAACGVTGQVFMIFATNPPHRPDSKGQSRLPDCMNLSCPVGTKALHPIFADRRTRTGSVLKQFAGEGLT